MSIRITREPLEQRLKAVLEDRGYAETVRLVARALESKDASTRLRPEDFSLRGLAEAFMGWQWVRALEQHGRGMHASMETGDAVDATAFSNITGQIIYSKILEGYQNPTFVADRLMDRIPTRLDGEKIPGIASQYDDRTDGAVGEGMPFPSLGLGEDYIETPSTEKRGVIVPVSKEAIYFDRTGILLRRAREQGETRLGIRKEKRCLSVILGLTNPFSWKGTAYNTFIADSTGWAAVGRGAGGNLLASNEFVDWTDIDALYNDRAAINDPDTGEPVLSGVPTILVMPAKLATARYVLDATSTIQVGAPGATSSTTLTQAKNPYSGIELLTSELAYRLHVAASTANPTKVWYAGDFKRAFAYMENWGMELLEAPSNAEAAFERDIVMRFRVDERGAPAVLAPWAVTMCTG